MHNQTVKLKPDDRDNMLPVFLFDPTTGKPLDALAWDTASLKCVGTSDAAIFAGGVNQRDIAPATATLNEYTSQGFVKYDNGYSKGLYQFGVPNSILADADAPDATWIRFDFYLTIGGDDCLIGTLFIDLDQPARIPGAIGVSVNDISAAAGYSAKITKLSGDFAVGTNGAERLRGYALVNVKTGVCNIIDVSSIPVDEFDEPILNEFDVTFYGDYSGGNSDGTDTGWYLLPAKASAAGMSAGSFPRLDVKVASAVEDNSTTAFKLAGVNLSLGSFDNLVARLSNAFITFTDCGLTGLGPRSYPLTVAIDGSDIVATTTEALPRIPVLGETAWIHGNTRG